MPASVEKCVCQCLVTVEKCDYAWVDFSEKFHDRFQGIDNAELHNLGSSINCLGRRVTTYTTRDPKEIAKVMKEL